MSAQSVRTQRMPLFVKYLTIAVFVLVLYKLININNDLIINRQLEKYIQRVEAAKESERQYVGETELPTSTTLDPIALKLRQRQRLLNCQNQPLVRETLLYGEYWLVRNLVIGSVSQYIGCAESITYTTHGDYTFFDNLPLLAKRWHAPISFAIFAPGDDALDTIASIQYARNCLPESDFIREYVTFHIYIPYQHMPDNLTLAEYDADSWSYDCEVPSAPYQNVSHEDMYKARANLTYPINVGRNIARKSANTYFVFASDIELYPNKDFVQKFLDLVDRNSTAVLNGSKPRVFPLPVFELEENVQIPETKTELLEMLQEHLAIPFHAKVCKTCHLVPNQKEWLQANASEQLSVFSVGKRYDKFRYWEPFYVSDNTEPLFDERVTWEGQSNKRIQNYAMCLLDYEYHVLHPAFLVHSPGIKILNKKSPRFNYVREMNKRIRKEIKPEYAVLYGTNKKCTV